MTLGQQRKSAKGATIAAKVAIAASMSFATIHAANADTSEFQCNNLETASEIQLMEGKQGMFFRIIPDIKMFHPFTDATIDNIVKISAALKAKGTTLIYVPVPTKSMVLPDLLPASAQLYGFEPSIANKVYDDVIERLEAKGVIAVDIAAPMRANAKGNNGDFAFFKTDFHWTAQGARPAAEAVVKRMKTLPGFESEPNLDLKPVELPSAKIPSTMHKLVQRYCRSAIPAATAHVYEFPAVAANDVLAGNDTTAGGSDIFSDVSTSAIALVGTSFSDMGASNFAGFLQYYSALSVENYSISGGNQFGSILSYLTSREFKQSRPKFLIWENPIYNNLAQFGDAPLNEILASAKEDCGPNLEAKRLDDRTVSINLNDQMLDGSQTILADIGDNLGRKAKFTFSYASGDLRERIVERGDRLRSTGRYFLPLNDLSGEKFSKVAISFDADISEAMSVSVCRL